MSKYYIPEDFNALEVPLDDGTEVTFEVIMVFEVEGREYIALTPAAEDGEEVDEVEDKQENSESEEVLVFLDAKILLNEDVLEIEEVAYRAVKPVNSLPVDKYYVQIATCSKYENMEAIVKKYGKNYPIVVYQPSGRSDYQVMIGGLNKDEYAIVLERFRKAGFKDAFLRSTF